MVGERREQDAPAERLIQGLRAKAFQPVRDACVQCGLLECDRQQTGLEPLTQIRISVAELGDRVLEDLDCFPATTAAPEEHATELERGLASPARIFHQGERFSQVVGASGRERQPLGRAELVEDVCALVSAGRLLERAAEVGDGGFRGPMRERARRGFPEGRHDASIRARGNEQELGGDLFDRRRRLGQDRRGPRVAALALGRWKSAVDRGAHDRMHEAERQLGAKDVHAAQHGCRLQGALPVELGHRGGVVKLDIVAQDGDGPCE